MMSAAKATGWAWKLPPEIALSWSGNTIGLSVTAPASMVSVRAALVSRSSAAPITCGWQRKLYGSCTRPQRGMAGNDFAAVEQLADRRGDADLTGLAAQFGEARVEGFDASP